MTASPSLVAFAASPTAPVGSDGLADSVALQPPDGRGTPLWVRPRGAAAAAGPDALIALLERHRDAIETALTEHGAIVFRGFGVADATTFQRAAEVLAPNLADEYLGTTPRAAIAGKVKTATELGGIYLVPPHLELSFLPTTPRRLFFACFQPADQGGETTLCDFRAVARDMDAAVRARFEQRGLRLVRNYDGPRTRLGFDPQKTKRWDEMFETEDRDAIVAKAADNGLEASWQPNDRLRLVCRQPAFRAHPVTGQPVWFNHLTVFHMSVAEGEYRHLFARTGSLTAVALSKLGGLAARVRQRFEAQDDLPTQYSYADGSPIPEGDVAHVRELTWRHLVPIDWRRGDMVAIDNHAVAHGRLPFRGRRQIAVVWG